MSDVNESPGTSSTSRLGPSTSSASGRDVAGVATATPSTSAGHPEASDEARPPKAFDTSSAGVRWEDVTSGVRAKVASIKDTLAEARNVVQDRYRAVSESTDDFTHDSPWKAVALAALAGVIVGMLAAR
jgi:ElaB protein